MDKNTVAVLLDIVINGVNYIIHVTLKAKLAVLHKILKLGEFAKTKTPKNRIISSQNTLFSEQEIR